MFRSMNSFGEVPPTERGVMERLKAGSVNVWPMGNGWRVKLAVAGVKFSSRLPLPSMSLLKPGACIPQRNSTPLARKFVAPKLFAE